MARELRKKILCQAKVAKGTMHWGGFFSTVEIAAVLYSGVLNCIQENSFDKRDKFILSKGHSGLAFYIAMTQVGLLDEAVLDTYQQDGSHISELMSYSPDLGFEFSGGSLGIGPSYGAGLALLAKRKKYSYKVYVEVGDGEIDEGSVWEAAMFASQNRLDNLCMIVDANGIQSDGYTKDILSWKNLKNQLESFGWYVCEVDGHDTTQLLEAFHDGFLHGKPFALIAHTIKGKGVSFMENVGEYHDKALTPKELEMAAQELGVNL